MRVSDERLMNEYLDVCGASPLCIAASDNRSGFAVRVIKRSQTANHHHSRIVWLPKDAAVRVARSVNRKLTPEHTAGEAMAELHRVCDKLSVAPTPHATTLKRARELSIALNIHLERLRNGRALREFNVTYRVKREKAATRGEGFMPLSTAMSRLRKAVIKNLIAGSTGMGMPIRSLMSEVFDNAACQGAEQ